MMDTLDMSNLSNHENKSESAVSSVIDLLLASNFIPNINPRIDVFQTNLSHNFLTGKTSKDLAKFGGQLRFEKVGTNIKARVNSQTTYFYFLQGLGTDCVKGIASHDTRNIDSIKKTVDDLCCQ